VRTGVTAHGTPLDTQPVVPKCGCLLCGADVINVLRYLFAVRGLPEHIRSDNGPEFVAHSVRRWLSQAGVNTLFIAKSSPWENGYVESFNEKLRDELLNRELFLGLEDAHWAIDRWLHFVCFAFSWFNTSRC